MNEPASPETGAAYQVYARKYRPATFAGLVGQDAMVRTLTNAIRSDRLAQAYGDQQRFEVQSGTDGGFTVIIEIPFQPDGQATIGTERT